MPEITANGIHLYYEERGRGDPLVLIMGLGADCSLWEEHVQAYEKHFRCILVDNRGAGRSDKPAGPYTPRMMAADTLGLMDALAIQKAHVSGISMGSCIATEMALAAPQRIRSLTLISGWPQCDAYTVRIFEMFKSVVPYVGGSTFTRLLQLWIFAPSYFATHMDDLLRREEMGKNNPYPMPLHAFIAQADACISHDALDRLAQITAPTLVTVGDQDIFTPLHYSQTIHERIAGSELFVLPGCGHTHHWEALAAFNAHTLDFMRRH